MYEKIAGYVNAALLKRYGYSIAIVLLFYLFKMDHIL
ncbi:hypothetical protein GGU45_003854 [Niabella hirudinis]